MSDAEYIEIARADPTWREIAASFAIEGLEMSEQDEVVAGRMIAGEIGLQEAIQLIRAKAGVPAKAGEMMINESLQ